MVSEWRNLAICLMLYPHCCLRHMCLRCWPQSGETQRVDELPNPTVREHVSPGAPIETSCMRLAHRVVHPEAHRWPSEDARRKEVCVYHPLEFCDKNPNGVCLNREFLPSSVCQTSVSVVRPPGLYFYEQANEFPVVWLRGAPQIFPWTRTLALLIQNRWMRAEKIS